ncbi:MAG: EAL domain-containing protein [Hydrogenobacter sp.]
MKPFDFFKKASQFITSEDFALKDLLKLCAQALDADRVSFWSVKEDVLFCEYMYIKESEEFIGGLLVKKESCIELIEYLESEGILISKEALKDRIVSKCLGEYINFEGTKAVLIAPFLREGKVEGFILCERADRSQSGEKDYVALLLSASVFLSYIYERQKVSFTVSLYKTLSSVNQAIIKAKSREEIFQEVCRIAVEVAGLRMAWIGLLDDAGNLKPVASYGYVENYLENININIHDEKLNKGPSARAILEKAPQINNDTETNPTILPWRAQMLRRGYLSSCAYPIKFKDEVIGSLNFYSDKKGFFTDEVVKLIEELGEDLSFALEHIDLLKNMRIMYMIAEQSYEWILITDTDGRIIYANPAVERISGYKREDLLGKTPRVFKSGFHSREFYKELWETLLSGREFSAIFVNRKKDGSIFYLDAVISPIKDESGSIINFVSTARDITYVRQMEERIHKMLNYDLLTNLPNKNSFFSELESAVEKTPESNFVVLLVDIYNMRGINATFGSNFGDEVLKAFAKNLSMLPGFCARYGNDEFALFKRVDNIEEVYELISGVFKAGELNIEGHTHRLGLHIGISLYPADGLNANQLLNNAEIALRKSMEDVPGSYEFYNREEGERLSRFVKMEEELRGAFDRNEFSIYFQAIYRSSDLKIVMAEELLRWNSRTFGLLQAREFIPLLERIGLVVDIGYYVFDKCAQIIKEYGINVPICVNLSPLQLQREDLVEKLCQIVEKYGVSPGYLNVELTEEVIVQDIQRAKKVMEALKKCGFLITLDDFGVKYSSLSYLTQFPVDYIKVDISFVRLVDTDEKIFRIVMAILNVAKTLGIKTVAEGVERESQLNILRDIGCDYLQGFYLSKPVPLEKFIAMLS